MAYRLLQNSRRLLGLDFKSVAFNLWANGRVIFEHKTATAQTHWHKMPETSWITQMRDKLVKHLKKYIFI